MENHVKGGYNTNVSVHNTSTIAYDRKVYKELGAYINKNLWEHMDEKLLHDVFHDIDIATLHDTSYPTFLAACKKHIPSVQAILPVQHQGTLAHLSLPSEYIDRLLAQEIDIFTTTKNTQLTIGRVLVIGSKEDLESDKKNRKITITPLAKTLIANILTLLIIQEEQNKKAKIVAKKIITMKRSKPKK